MDDALEYFRSIDKVIQEDVSIKDEVFISNIFKELRGKEMRLACHHDGSKIFEKLIPLFDQTQLQIIWEYLLNDNDGNDGSRGIKLSGHRYGSHVMESLLRATNDFNNLYIYGSKLLNLLLLNRNSLFDMDQYTSHVARLLLNKMENIQENDYNLSLVLKDWFDRSFQIEEIWQVAGNGTSSPILQAIMEKILIDSSNNLLIKRIISNDQNQKENVQNAMFDKFSSHFLECLVGKMSFSDLQFFYTNFMRSDSCLQERIIKHEISNFVLQKLIECSHSSLFELILNDISNLNNFNLVHHKRVGILIKILEWSIRNKAQTDQVVKFLFETFKLKTTEQRSLIIPLALDLETFDQYNPIKNETQTQIETKNGNGNKNEINDSSTRGIKDLGCTLVALFPKLKNKIITSSFLKLPNMDSLCRHRSASHVMESFFIYNMELLSSKNAGNLIIDKLNISSLVCDRYASHVIEKLWHSSPLNLKNVIMEAMSKDKKRIEDSVHGRIVWKKCKMDTWIHKREEWNAAEELKNRKKKYFDDLIGESSTLNSLNSNSSTSKINSINASNPKKINDKKEKKQEADQLEKLEKEKEKLQDKKKKSFKKAKTEEEKLLIMD